MNRYSSRIRCALLICFAALANAAWAGTVTNTADSGAGSLRAVLAAAAANETITFSVPLPATIALASELPVTKSVVISGPGADQLTISSAGTRVLHLDTSAKNVTLINLTLTGNSSGNGGCILNDGGNLTLGVVALSGCTSSGTGGAIYNSYNAAGNQLSIDRSAITNGSANKSAAIDFIGFKLTISNTTISGNHASDSAGALSLLNAEAYVYNSTIAGNSATFVGGINSQSSNLTFESSIIDGNTDGTGVNDLNRTGGGTSVVNATTTLFTETFVPADNVINGTNSANLFGISAQLMGLALNGGSTLNRELSASSPAIDAGSNSQGYSSDQIGNLRATAGMVDMGAVQFIAPIVPEVAAIPVPLMSGPWLVLLMILLAIGAGLSFSWGRGTIR